MSASLPLAKPHSLRCLRYARDSDSRAQAVSLHTPFQGRMSPGRAHIEHHRDVRASEHRQRSWFGFAEGEEEPVECRRACPLERGYLVTWPDSEE